MQKVVLFLFIGPLLNVANMDKRKTQWIIDRCIKLRSFSSSERKGVYLISLVFNQTRMHKTWGTWGKRCTKLEPILYLGLGSSWFDGLYFVSSGRFPIFTKWFINRKAGRWCRCASMAFGFSTPIALLVRRKGFVVQYSTGSIRKFSMMQPLSSLMFLTF